MARTYFLKYNKPNIHTFQDMHPDSQDEKGKHIRLIPGINEISQEDYDALMGIGRKVKDKLGNEIDAKPHPFFLKMQEFDMKLEKPLLEWVSGFAPEDKEQKKFSELKDTQALIIINSTFSPELLNKFLEKEKRPEIIKAINDKIEKLKLPSQKAA